MTMKVPQLVVGKKKARLPVIQGGMAVRISMAPLAAAVANAGGVGVIAGSGLSPEEVYKEAIKARSLTDGVIWMNAMLAVTNFKEIVLAAIKGGVDGITSGAGFSRDLPGICREWEVAYVPIVGSGRLAKVAEKCGATAIVAESFEAGGHLGSELSTPELLDEVLAEVKNTPVVIAGNLADGHDLQWALSNGAVGVQMGSRFAATRESSAPECFKEMLVKATAEDLVLIESPVGYPGRAIRNRFTRNAEKGVYPLRLSCRKCLKRCNHKYCIVSALEDSQRGNCSSLLFAGLGTDKIRDVPTTTTLMERLEIEYIESAKKALFTRGATAREHRP